MLIENITPQELKTLLDNGEVVEVIDVRMPWEVQISQVNFARHIVMNEIPARLDEIPGDRLVVLMCRSGARSQQVGGYLIQKGWNSSLLRNLDGGILRWARDIDPSLSNFY